MCRYLTPCALVAWLALSWGAMSPWWALALVALVALLITIYRARKG